MSVRTDPDDNLGHRYDAIMKASDFFECNKSDAVTYACDSLPDLVENLEDALEHDELSPRLARELAEALSTRYLEISIEGRCVTASID